MKPNYITIINNALESRGYRQIEQISKDDFGRFHGYYSKNGKAFFVKGVGDQSSYRFRSLEREAKVSTLLSKLTNSRQIGSGKYRLVIPMVKDVIKENNTICLVSEKVNGKILIKFSTQTQLKLLKITIDSVKSIKPNPDLNETTQELKQLTKRALILSLPIRLLKALILSPRSARQLVVALIKALDLLVYQPHKTGLVHQDINASNIIVDGHKIYLTDWEEAGWGITNYNLVGPLCVHWQKKLIRNELLKHTEMSLLAHRIISLFNQSGLSNTQRSTRNQEILQFITK